jgi:hypothetical protein
MPTTAVFPAAEPKTPTPLPLAVPCTPVLLVVSPCTPIPLPACALMPKSVPCARMAVAPRAQTPYEEKLALLSATSAALPP